jgi:hypothetical protein
MERAFSPYFLFTSFLGRCTRLASGRAFGAQLPREIEDRFLRECINSGEASESHIPGGI